MASKTEIRFNSTELPIKKDINVPVKVDKVAERGRISFRNGCPECHNPISQHRVCDNQKCDKEEVEYGELKKIWEVGEEKYVFDKDTIKEVKKSVIEDGMTVEKIVDLKDVKFRLRGKKPYYLSPREDEDARFSLLNEVLHESETALICKFTPRSRESLYAVWSNGQGLIATKIAFMEAIKEQPRMETQPEVSEQAKENMTALIEAVKEETQTKVVENRQRTELEEVLEAKARGEEIEVEETAEEVEMENIEKELEQAITVE